LLVVVCFRSYPSLNCVPVATRVVRLKVGNFLSRSIKRNGQKLREIAVAISLPDERQQVDLLSSIEKARRLLSEDGGIGHGDAMTQSREEMSRLGQPGVVALTPLRDL
jgi:hypothetical protein